MKWIVIVIALLAIFGFSMVATDNVVDQEYQAICQEVNRSCENFRKLDIIHTVNTMECNRFRN